VSALTGANILKPLQQTDSSRCNWYRGQSLIEILNHKVFIRDDVLCHTTLGQTEEHDQIKSSTQQNDKDKLLMEIYDKFSNDKKQLFIKCLIQQGRLEKGDRLSLLPQNLPVQALTIQDTRDRFTKAARKGELITIELNASDEQAVQVGSSFLTLRGDESHFALSNKLLVELQIFKDSEQENETKRYISNGLSCMMHKGNLQTHAVIEKLQIEDEQEQSKKQMIVQGPAKVQCRLSLSDTIVLQRFDSFILRDCYKNETFAIGKILKYSPYTLPEQPKPITKELLKAQQIQEKERIR